MKEKIKAAVLMSPWLKVDRQEFLTKVLKNKIDSDTLEKVLNGNPKMFVSRTILDKIAQKEIIKQGLYTALISALAAIPSNTLLTLLCAVLDIVQAQLVLYLISQKLLYLYGGKDLTEGKKKLGENMKKLSWVVKVLMIGKTAMIHLSKKLSKKVAKTMITKVLLRAGSRVWIVSILRQVAKWFGLVLTKDFMVSAINFIVVGLCAIASAFISFWIFYPPTRRLRNRLREEDINDIRALMKKDLEEEKEKFE